MHFKEITRTAENKSEADVWVLEGWVQQVSKTRQLGGHGGRARGGGWI